MSDILQLANSLCLNNCSKFWCSFCRWSKYEWLLHASCIKFSQTYRGIIREVRSHSSHNQEGKLNFKKKKNWKKNLVTLFLRDWFANGWGAARYQNRNGNAHIVTVSYWDANCCRVSPVYVMLHLELNNCCQRWFALLEKLFIWDNGGK